MATKYIVNNVTGQTITGNLTINGNVTITGTTNTRPYKVYTALLSQTGTDAPVATVLENTLNLNPTYFYNGEGAYHIEDLSGLFTINKTLVLAQGTGSGVITININNTTLVEIGCNNINNGLVQDGLLSNSAFEIRVYN
jgi:hypothetical protein